MTTNIQLSVILEMLIAIESRLNTLIEFQIENENLELFNEESKKHRKIIIQTLKDVYPLLDFVQKGKE